jgi:hypothetical protein
MSSGTVMSNGSGTPFVNVDVRVDNTGQVETDLNFCLNKNFTLKPASEVTVKYGVFSNSSNQSNIDEFDNLQTLITAGSDNIYNVNNNVGGILIDGINYSFWSGSQHTGLVDNEYYISSDFYDYFNKCIYLIVPIEDTNTETNTVIGYCFSKYKTLYSIGVEFILEDQNEALGETTARSLLPVTATYDVLLQNTIGCGIEIENVLFKNVYPPIMHDVNGLDGK